MANLSNMSPQAMAAWEALTQSWGRPLTPTSAYRDPSYNASVGGARGSQHIHGNAFDVSTAGMSPEERSALIQAAKAAGFQGFGGYDNSLHFDVGPSRTWGADYTGATTPEWLTAALGGQPRTQISTSGVNEMPMTPQQPQGLLGYLGIQKQDPAATDQTALPFYQRDRFKDTMGNLAIALNEMRLNPSQAIPQVIQARQGSREQERMNNRTVEWLRSQPNGERFASLAESVGAGPALQMYQAAMKGADRTAAQTNFAEYQRILAEQGPAAADQFLRMAEGGTRINMPAQIGTIPAGYRAEYNENGQPVALVPIAGGPADTEAQAAADAAAARASGDQTRGSVVADTIDNIIDTLDRGGIFNLPEAGIAGQWLSSVNQEARDVKNQLSVIQSTVALDRLQQMRDASKTGGALGGVSERELDLLMNALGSIDQSSSPQILRENLLQIKRIMTKIEQDPVASSAYYGGTTPSGAGGFAVTGSIGG